MRKLLFGLDNEPLSAITHLIGMLLSIAGLVLMVVYASIHGSAKAVVGFSIFGAALVLLYLASSIYHFIPISSRAKRIFQKIDHMMIYVLIAGTYTPICLVALGGGWGWSLFGVIWGFALVGIVWKSITSMSKLVSTIFYLIMGWQAVIAFIPIRASMSASAIWLLLAGGAFYSIGAIFFGVEHKFKRRKWFSLHDLWHIFVMLGSFSHFWLVYRHIL